MWRAAQRNYLVTLPSIVIVPPSDECILANGAELERWNAYNKQLYSVLFLPIKGTANSFLVRLAGRADSRKQPDVQAAWKGMTKKCLNFRQCSDGVFSCTN